MKMSIRHEFICDDGFVESTSLHTATTAPIIMEETDHVRLSFAPKLVDNPNDVTRCICGDIIFEKKKKKDEFHPTDNVQISRSNVRVGDSLKLSLRTDATYNLYKGLMNLYELKQEIGTTELGVSRYRRVDSALAAITRKLKDDPSAISLLSTDGNFDFVKTLLRALSTSESVEKLKEILESVDAENLNNISTCARIAQLEEAIKLFDENINAERDEEFWQKEVFEKHQWILAQIFSLPCTLFQSKAYVGGKGIDNAGGNVADFVYKNGLTRNAAIVEIKRPDTPIIKEAYRQTYSFTSNFSGAINQVLNYRDSLAREINSLANGQLNAFSPTCVVVIGRTSEFGIEPKKMAAFENYRAILSNVIIITYDELLAKMKELHKIMVDDGTGE